MSSFIFTLADAPAGQAATPAPAAPVTSAPGTGAAQGPTSPFGAACGSNSFSSMVPFILIFVVFYFMLIRPQQKKQREQQEWLKSLKKGDDVVTTGGLLGRISGLTDSVVTLEVQEKVRLRVLRTHVAGRPPAPGAPAAPPPETKP